MPSVVSGFYTAYARSPIGRVNSAMMRCTLSTYFLGSKLNILLFFLPLSFIAKYGHWGDGLLFLMSMLALAPLAERLGFVTEQLAMYTNDTLGGLINATFGNATEDFALSQGLLRFALSQGLLRVVQLSLLGSVISNLLLVMGSAFIVGGINHSTQSFNQQGVSVNCGLLMLAVVAILLPSLLSETETLTSGSRHLFEDEDSRDEKSNDVEGGSVAGASQDARISVSGYTSLSGSVTGKEAAENGAVALPQHMVNEGVPTMVRRGSWRSTASADAEDSGDCARNIQMARLSRNNTPYSSLNRGRAADIMDGIEETGLLASTAPVSAQPTPSPCASQATRMTNTALVPVIVPVEEKELTPLGCFLWLTGTTIIISILSEFIVGTIKGASVELNIPLPFLVTIILPIVGNAAEHASALIFAWKKKMDIALGVAVGSATQISVLVIPFCVVLAWGMGQSLDLNFNSFESAVMFVSVLISSVVLQDGRSNWIKGVLLLLTYFMVAAGFWFHKDSDLSITDVDGA
eukprot:gene7659-813_t